MCAVLCWVVPAGAGTVGSLIFSPTQNGAVTINTSELGTATEIDLTNGNDSTKGNSISDANGDFSYFDLTDYSYYVDFSSALTSGLTFTPGLSSGTWNNLLVFGTGYTSPTDTSNIYSFSADQLFVTRTAPSGTMPGTLNLEFFGTFNDSTNTLSSNTASFDIALSQSTIGGPIGEVDTFSVPSGQIPGTPEPVTYGLVGAALIGLGFVRRHKKV